MIEKVFCSDTPGSQKIANVETFGSFFLDGLLSQPLGTKKLGKATKSVKKLCFEIDFVRLKNQFFFALKGRLPGYIVF